MSRRIQPTEWKSRPLLSFGLRTFVYLGPAAIGVGVVAELSSHLVAPAQFPQLAGWWLLQTIAGFACLVVSERITRRLLPLAALYRLSLIFPDHAPKRFAVARRAARPKEILRRLQGLADAGSRAEAEVVQTVLELSVALSVHDRATRGHSERVQVLTDMLGRELRLSGADRARLRWAALLHDIGKLQVPSRVLNKPGPPDGREWVVIRRHPAAGAKIVAPLLPWLGAWGKAVAQHHEQFDGSGYPLGLRGPEISLGARIVAVADVFEVMTAPRPYRRPVSVSKAREELVRVSGGQFDPVVVRAFLNLSVGELWPVVGIGSVFCQVPLLAKLSSLFGQTLAGLGGSTAVAGAAGTLLFAGVGHPADVRPLISSPPPRAQEVAPGPEAAAAATPQPESTSGNRTLAASTAPQPPPPATPSPTPSPSATPTSTPEPLPSATPTPLLAPVPQTLQELTALLHRLGL